MALIIDLDDLDQGGSTVPTDIVFGAPSGRLVAISSSALLPDLAANVYFEVQGNSVPDNNGLWRVNESDPTTSLIDAFKISGVDPLVNASPETNTILGTAGAAKNVFFDTEGRDIYLLEQGLLSGDGVTLQALYSFIKVEWKADPLLIPHPFPMIAITPEQFEFIDDWTPFDSPSFGPFSATDGFDWLDGGGSNDALENDDAGEPSWVVLGFRVGDVVTCKLSTFEPDFSFTILDITDGLGTDDVAEFATATVTAGSNDDDNTLVVNGAIRTRKLVRTGGWSEVLETGSVLNRQYAGVISLGSFEDTADLAYFNQGTDNTDLLAARNFDFTDAVNEAVKVYEEIGLDLGAGYVFADASPDTIADTSSAFITDGYVVGGQVRVRNALNPTNDGVYDITIVAAGLLTVTATGGGDAGLVAEATDTTAELAVDNRNAFDIRLRIRDGDTNGKSFDGTDLTGIGVSGTAGMDNKVFRFPLANATDLKIAATDAAIAGAPYDEMLIKYFDQAFNREVDSVTNRDFGIVIDVGTFSGVDGVTAGGATLTSAEGGIPTDASFTAGTIRIHDQTDENTIFTISGTPTATVVTITSTFTGSDSAVSFTLQRATPIVATIEEIYEFVQFQLRQNADIDTTTTVVAGRTADELLTFVGDALRCGEGIPANPQGGGSGVIIEGFDSNDTNDLSFFDNTGTSRTFPFVAAGTINFNLNLQNDTGPAEFFMFFEYTTRTTNSDIDTGSPSGDTYTLTGTLPNMAVADFIRIAGFVQDANNGIFIIVTETTPSAEYIIRRADGENVGTAETNQTVTVDENPIDSPDAIIVNDNGGSPIEGTIGGPSIGFDFDYDNNVQGGRTQAEDADIVIRALGEDVAAFVEVFGTITRATGLSFSLVAPLERNFTNPA